MDISLITPDRLTDAQRAAWCGLAAADLAYDSPFFDPAFTLAVARARRDVEIAVITDDGKIAGFFPFQRLSQRTGRPVGWRINDFQGAILAKGATLEDAELLRACRLGQWRFDHLPRSQTWCAAAHLNAADSPLIDLSSGYEHYLSVKQAQGESRLKTLERKARKMHREVGPLRLELESDDRTVLDTLLRWKADQLSRNHCRNIWSQAWARTVLDVLIRGEDAGCRGALSALYSGNELAALHFGIRSEGTMHWWISAYNHALDRYSPGSVLLLRLAEACAATGIRRIDLGKGAESYKRHFMTSAVPLAEGAVACNRWRQARERLVFQAARAIRETAWLQPAVRWTKHVRQTLTANQEMTR